MRFLTSIIGRLMPRLPTGFDLYSVRHTASGYEANISPNCQWPMVEGRGPTPRAAIQDAMRFLTEQDDAWRERHALAPNVRDRSAPIP